MKIMLVDDERSLCEAVEIMMERAGYEFVYCNTSTEAISLFEQERPDAVILDVMLPGINGFELCEAIRGKSVTVPILMLSAKCDIVDKRIGFKFGADDYLGKPFEKDELLLRIEALLRRRQTSQQSQIGDSSLWEEEVPTNFARTTANPDPTDEIIVDVERCEIIVRGTPVNLTAKEFLIVKLLASHPGKVFTKEDIIREVWGYDYASNAISIPTFVRHIREKIELDPSAPQLLQTVFGFGYRFRE